MTRILILLIFLTFWSGVKAQKQNCSVLLNHVLIGVDSTTYQAVLSSEILNSDFAYAYERNKNWEGIYIIGQDNYIEVFHPNSVPNDHVPVGFSWICHASLAANCIENYSLPDSKQITYSSDNDFDYLSAYTKDSSNLMETMEMNKLHYESWTKKIFNDSLNFLTTDYNSVAESDSSKNYLFHNITGIQIELNSKDSLAITQYLNLIGYAVESNIPGHLKFSNSVDFIELHFSEDIELATISTIYFQLNQSMELKHFSIGSSEMILEGNEGKWRFRF